MTDQIDPVTNDMVIDILHDEQRRHEVPPEPAEPPTPIVPPAPITPAVPAPETPGDPAEPPTVPPPHEPVEPIVPEPAEPGRDPDQPASGVRARVGSRLATGKRALRAHSCTCLRFWTASPLG